MNIANAKIIAFLRTEKPGVLALVGPSGCGKRYTIAEAARQTGVATTHHDLAHDAVAWGQLGSQQLAASTGLARCAHVVSNASERTNLAVLKNSDLSSSSSSAYLIEVAGYAATPATLLASKGAPASSKETM